MSKRRTPGKVRAFFHMVCSGHQGALSTRPIYASLPGHSSMLVRLGHLLQGARQHTNFLQNLDGLIDDDSWHYLLVATEADLPPEMPIWKDQTRSILEATRCAMDLTPESEKDYVQYWNGPPSDCRRNPLYRFDLKPKRWF